MGIDSGYQGAAGNPGRADGLARRRRLQDGGAVIGPVPIAKSGMKKIGGASKRALDAQLLAAILSNPLQISFRRGGRRGPSQVLSMRVRIIISRERYDEREEETR